MKESVWFKNYEQEVTGKRNKSNENKKIVFWIVPIMMILALASVFLSGKPLTQEQKQGMIPLICVFAFIIIFILIMMKIGRKKDPAKSTRENLKKLLRSDEEVESFDLQMSATPLKEFEVCSGVKMFLTQDYVGGKSTLGGDLSYIFIRREDIAYYDYAKTKSATGNPLKAAYFFDILDAKQKIIMNGCADSGAQLEQLIEMLEMAQPAIQKSRKK